ncbi:MAG: class I SAM-dependent methyltransferase [Actinomycetota bacterium]|nr:class I SAM-dependent methyltransferase [Actinomycetota bacterium]
MGSGAYVVAQMVLAPGSRSALSAVLRRWAAAHQAGNLVADVGCGPRSWLRELDAHPIGLDVSLSSVRSLQATGGRGVVASATALPLRSGGLDSAWCFGLLHHLSDDSATTALGELQRVVRPGGHAVVFDGVTPGPGGPLLARVVRAIDRGAWMRRSDALDALLGCAGCWDEEHVRYSAYGLDGVLATWTCEPRR